MKVDLRGERALIAVAVLLTGCGGGSGGGEPAPSGAAGIAGVVGDARYAYSGSAKPAVLDYEGGAVSVAAVSGASFSLFAMYPSPNLNNTSILFTQANGSIGTFQHGQFQQTMSDPNHYAKHAVFGHDGHIYFSSIQGDVSYHIERCNYDGTGITSLFVINQFPSAFDVSSNGQKIVYQAGNGLVSSNLNGTGSVLLDATGYEPSISPDSSTVVYHSSTGIYTIPIGGGTARRLIADSTYSKPVWSPDGNLVFVDCQTGSQKYIVSCVAKGPNYGDIFGDQYTQPYTYSSHASFSPDGKFFTAERSSTYGVVFGTAQIVTTDVSHATLSTVGTGAVPYWSPFPAARTFVGASGLLFTSASGFLYSQYQGSFSSLVAFTATTPTTAKATQIAQSSGTGTAFPLTYDLHADKLTGIKYMNNYFGAVNQLTVASTDAFISIDGTTGQVTSVAPFVTSRGTSMKPTIAGSKAVYKAQFLAVYNSKGKNVAPQGASTITLDAKSAQLVEAN